MPPLLNELGVQKGLCIIIVLQIEINAVTQLIKIGNKLKTDVEIVRQ